MSAGNLTQRVGSLTPDLVDEAEQQRRDEQRATRAWDWLFGKLRILDCANSASHESRGAE